MELSFIEFARALGVAMTIDVTVVTLAKFQDRKVNILKWVIPLTLLHVLFFGVAYSIAWTADQSFSGSLHLKITGMIGFSIIMYVVYLQYCEAIDIEPYFSPPDLDHTHLLLMVGVTWDALFLGFAGPAMVPVETLSEYSRMLTAIGVAVSVTATLATLAATLLRKIKFKNITFMQNFNIFGKFLAVMVLTFFGISSLLKGFEFEAESSFVLAIILSFTFTQLAFLIKKERIEWVAKQEAINAVA